MLPGPSFSGRVASILVPAVRLPGSCRRGHLTTEDRPPPSRCRRSSLVAQYSDPPAPEMWAASGGCYRWGSRWGVRASVGLHDDPALCARAPRCSGVMGLSLYCLLMPVLRRIRDVSLSAVEALGWVMHQLFPCPFRPKRQTAKETLAQRVCR